MPFLSLEHAQLSNGLTLLCGQVSESRSFEFTMHFNTGSRDESWNSAGVSHLLEHMMFRGCSGYPNSIVLAKSLEDLGGDSNAVTSYETTLYWIRGSLKKFTPGLELFSKFLLTPSFDSFEIERNIVLQELASDFNEENLNIDSETLAMNVLFGNDRLGIPILGHEKSLKALSVLDIKRKWEQAYVPSAAVLVVTSPYSFDFIYPHVERFLGLKWPTLSCGVVQPERRRYDLPSFLSENASSFDPIFLQENSDNQFSVRLLFPCVGGNSPDVIVQLFLQRILDDGISSRLQNSLREKLGLVYDVSADLSIFEDISLFSFDVTVSEENIVKLLQALRHQIERIVSEKISDEELERVKFRYLFDLESLDESYSRVLSRKVWNLFLNEDFSAQQEQDIVESLTADQVLACAKRVFSSSKKSAVLIGPKAARFRSYVESLLAPF